MFVTEGPIYLELQKTGGSHIRRLLSEYTGGRREGKHNMLPPGYSRDFVFGSIRNPWDWYVSLWAFGVGGRGGLRSRCVTGIDFSYYRRMLPKDMGINRLSPDRLLRSFLHDAVKPVDKWRQVYTSSQDPALFRTWLKLLLSNERRFDIGEGFAFSPLSTHAGLLTYRYLRLFTCTMFNTPVYSDTRLSSPDGIADYDRDLNFSKGMVRTEHLEEDLVRVLGKAGVPLTDKQTSSILNRECRKTNTSERNPAGYYYDDETVSMVEEKDHFLIEKYGYSAPVL